MKDVYIRKPNDKERRLLESCPIWEHEPAQWNAEYDERCETCLIIEGTAVVSGSDGQSYTLKHIRINERVKHNAKNDSCSGI